MATIAMLFLVPIVMSHGMGKVQNSMAINAMLFLVSSQPGEPSSQGQAAFIYRSFVERNFYSIGRV